METYILPELAFDDGALEPHISGAALEIHHQKHHFGYVQKANTVLEKIDDARRRRDFSRMRPRRLLLVGSDLTS
jgi:Fe-Mn family superoxide dismutase